MSKENNNKSNKRQHDIYGAIRFLENLYQEILLAEKLFDIQDKEVLNKFNETIQIIKKELLNK